MTLRAALPESARQTRGITVEAAAVELGCDPATVRAALRNGELEGWKVGKTGKPGGVRIELQSVIVYKARHAIGGDRSPTMKRVTKREEYGFTP